MAESSLIPCLPAAQFHAKAKKLLELLLFSAWANLFQPLKTPGFKESVSRNAGIYWPFITVENLGQFLKEVFPDLWD